MTSDAPYEDHRNGTTAIPPPPPPPGYDGTPDTPGTMGQSARVKHPMAQPGFFEDIPAGTEQWYGADYVTHWLKRKRAEAAGQLGEAVWYLKLMLNDNEDRIREMHTRVLVAERRTGNVAFGFILAILLVLAILWGVTCVRFGHVVWPTEVFTIWH
jgi:hypothetical protein